MRYSLILLAIATMACGKKEPAGPTQLGTSGVFIDLGAQDLGDPKAFLKEQKPGYWYVSAPLGGNGSTNVTVKYERGMPTKSSLEAGVKEDAAIGWSGSVEEGPNGMLLQNRVKPGAKPEYFAYV